MATTNARMQQRRDTSVNWTSNNPVLLLAELGFETDTKALKIGDGLTAWAALPYIIAPRRVVSTTVAVVAGGTAVDNLELFRGAAIFSIETDKAAWVRLYNSVASSAADVSRDRSTDPNPGSGVLLEVITTGADIIVLTPTPMAFNAETPLSSTYPIRVTNDDGTADVAVTITCTSLFN